MPTVDLKQIGGSPVRILVVKLSSFGDIVLVTGALRELRRALPKAEITLAVEHRWADVVRNSPHIDGLIECSSQERVSMDYLVEVYRHLSGRGRFDAAIDYQGNRRSAAWIYLSGARLKLGRGRFRPGWQFSIATDRTQHAVAISAEICRGIGMPVDNLDPEIHTSPVEEERLDELMDAESIPRNGFILFNPFSRWFSKSWPEENVAEFIDRLKHCFDDYLILTGGLDDRPRAERLLHLVSPGAISSLVGRLPLSQALCLFRRARLMVSCDSGPMHAAAAFGVPVVALFGPTHPEHTGPWGPNHCVVRALRPAEHNAFRNDPEAKYMRALNSGAVFEAVSAKLIAMRGVV